MDNIITTSNGTMLGTLFPLQLEQTTETSGWYWTWQNLL